MDLFEEKKTPLDKVLDGIDTLLSELIVLGFLTWLVIFPAVAIWLWREAV